MRLSEAIRLGAMMKPQARGAFHRKLDGTCVIEAALDAIGQLEGNNSANIFTALKAAWPYVGSHEGPGVLITCHDLWYRNDARCMWWTREQIADWVEECEKALDIPAIEPIPRELALVEV